MRSHLNRALAAVVFVLTTLLNPTSVHAQETDYQSEYESIIYDADSGLSSSEINALAQTADGYIWAGSYSGLYRYDGNHFVKMNISDRITSCMALYVDSQGNLWIGTNDNGVCRYNPETGELFFLTTENGLPADAIRSIGEDRSGNLYISTVSYLCRIDSHEKIHVYNHMENITGVRTLCYCGDGIMAGVSNSGSLFLVKDDTLLDSREYETEGIYYAAVGTDLKGNFVVGTSSHLMEIYSLHNNQLVKEGEIDSGNVAYYNDILYNPENDCFFFSCENGLGVFDPDHKKITLLNREHFNSSVSDAIIDYQGNIWFASNKHGILEYSRNPFVNLFTKAGLSQSVVNSVSVRQNEIYVGMDNGLAVLDKTTFTQKQYDFIPSFDGVRIRHIGQDSKGNTWISTYGQIGLVCIDPSYNITTFDESKGTLGGRFRFTKELSDGTIVASTNTGLNFIENGEVVATIGEAQGLPAAQILSLVEEEDGTLRAGSDGDGIYLIKDRIVTSRIGAEEGLGSLVIMRIVPFQGGYIYVTSNALYYDNGSTINRLTAFPYSNNYDVYITPENEAWISSSAGIFLVRAEELIANGDYHYTLLDYTRGFNTSLTANAWNDLLGNEEEDLLLCCTEGLMKISTKNYNSFDTDYLIRLNNIICDDVPLSPRQDGSYEIPASAKRIQISAAVLNYTLSNPLVHIFLEGAEDEGLTAYQKDLTALNYTNLHYGDYTLHIQILDDSDYSVLRDQTYAIHKKAMIWELLIVRIIAGLIVAVGMFLVGSWVVKQTTVARQAEQIKEAKEEAERANSAKSRFLANMSHEIRTPINTIMGMDEMILREDISDEVAGFATDIRNASESLLGLVNDILDLSKIESGKMDLVEQEYNTVDLVRGLTSMIRLRAASKNLEFFTDIDPNLPSRVYGDDGKIRQVLLNLLTNSVKYTEQGHFTLSIQCGEKTEDALSIRYSVRDTGIGIRSEDIGKVFSAFQRLDEKRNSGIQGTGLGLDISHRFVELMGGELTVDSIYGKGSTFSFTISQKIVDATPIGEFHEKDPASNKRRDSYKPLFIAPEAHVLAVDDNAMNQTVLKGLLRRTKVNIDTAMSGAECLKLAGSKHYDVILLDHMMPEMDGVETLHELRKSDTTTPVLALTANAISGMEEFYLNEGFQGYIAKPIDAVKLEEVLRSFLPKELVQEAPEEAAPAPKTANKDRNIESTSVAAAGTPATDEGNAPAAKEASAEESTSGSLINQEEGISYCAGDEDFYHEMLHDYIDQEGEKRETLQKLLEEGDTANYAVHIHALKGNSKTIGAMDFAETCFALEKAGKAGDLKAILDGHDKMLREYRAVLNEARRIIG